VNSIADSATGSPTIRHTCYLVVAVIKSNELNIFASTVTPALHHSPTSLTSIRLAALTLIVLFSRLCLTTFVEKSWGIGASSEMGNGTRFWFTLPVARGTLTKAEAVNK